MRSIDFGLKRLEEIEALPVDWYVGSERELPKQHLGLLRELLTYLN